MYKIITVLIGLCVSAGAQNFSQGVTTNSTRIAPPGNAGGVVLSVPMVVTQGQLVSVGQQVYMAVEAGTITNAPTHSSGTAGTPALRAYGSTQGSTGRVTLRRVAIYVDNTGTNRIWLATGGSAAVVDTGVRLEPGDRLWMQTAASLSAIGEGPSTVAIQEVY